MVVVVVEEKLVENFHFAVERGEIATKGKCRRGNEIFLVESLSDRVNKVEKLI